MKKKDYEKLSKHLERRINELQKQLQHCPEGKLICARNGKWIKWYVSDGKTLTYLPKSERKKAEQLAKKKLLIVQLQECKKEKRAVDSYLKYHCFDIPMSQKLLHEIPGFKDLLSPICKSHSEKVTQWMEEDYERNTTYADNLIHKTSSGIMVRSKSEAMIVMILNDYQIPYRYECALYLDSKLMYPDFTIMHPVTGEIYYWEHFGKADDPQYLESIISRLQKYIRGGYIPGINLITTYETKKHPLSVEDIKIIVEQYFM